MIRTATASWHGNGREGKGTLTSQSGVLAQTSFGYRSRFEDGPGTNPEELLAASHAGCFTMALAFELQQAGFTATELDTQAAVSLEPNGDHYKVASSALTLRAQVPAVDIATFNRLAEDAEKNCPISRMLSATAKVTLQATLVGAEQRQPVPQA
jgi:osmotically inducible protein OsmC